MEFLESLYSIENFGIYLFVLIGILVILFLIILFFGKKDEQKRKKEKEEVISVAVGETSPVAFKETSEPTSVVIPPEEESSPISMEELSKEPEPISYQEEEEKEFDFDALAEAISKELESIEGEDAKEVSFEPEVEETTRYDDEFKDYRVYEPRDTKEETSSYDDDYSLRSDYEYEDLKTINEEKMEFSINNSVSDAVEEPRYEKVEEPVYFERKRVEENSMEEAPKREMDADPKPPMPSVFSSVYVNRDKEEPVLKETNQVTEPASFVKPVAPKMELPKMMDLPKRKD